MNKLTPEQQKKLVAAAELVGIDDMEGIQKMIEFQDFLDKSGIIDKIETLSTSHDSLAQETDTFLSNYISNMGDTLKALDKKISDSTGTKAESAELKDLYSKLSEQIKAIEGKIPDLPDLSSYDEKLAEIEGKIPVIVPEDAISMRDKLESLVEDDRLDISKIKGTEIFTTQSILDRAIAILDQRTSFLVQKVANLPVAAASSGGSASIGGAVSGGTLGSVLFINPDGILAQDNNDFFWDPTLMNLGLRTNAPTHTVTHGVASTGIAIYNTADQTVNYERIVKSWQSNIFTFASEAGGTGVKRNFQFSGGTVTSLNNNILNTSVPTLIIANTTPSPGSGAANQQYSPAVSFVAQGWKTNATAGSQEVRFNQYVVAVQGTSAPSGTLTVTSQINGGTEITMFTMTSTAPTLVVVGGIAATGVLSCGNGSINSNMITGSSTSAASTTNAISLFGGASTVFYRVSMSASGNTSLTTGTSYGNLLVGSAPITTFTSGTHAVIANTVINAVGVITNAGATVANTASLYVTGAGSGGTNNYAVLVNSGNTMFANGNISLGTAGNKINITTGSNASIGTATLSGGTVTVNTTAVTANSIIQLTDATTGALTNVGAPTVGTIVAGTSFVINSTNVLDASNVNWFIIN